MCLSSLLHYQVYYLCTLAITIGVILVLCVITINVMYILFVNYVVCVLLTFASDVHV